VAWIKAITVSNQHIYYRYLTYCSTYNCYYISSTN